MATFETKKLTKPIKRGSEAIASVTLRCPDAGALRGMKLVDIMQMDVTAMTRLLPRITEPALLPDEIAALAPPDLLTLSAAVIGFFVTEEQIQAEEARLQ